MPEDYTDLVGAAVIAVALVAGIWLWIKAAAWIAGMI
jgi:hypothetical protein